MDSRRSVGTRRLVVGGDSAGILDLISEREDFWFCPHHKEALHTEDLWLKRFKIRIIPYCLSDDIIALENHWGFRQEHRRPDVVQSYALYAGKARSEAASGSHAARRLPARFGPRQRHGGAS